MAAVTESIPNACPGTKSDAAGKAAPCQGCPNQKVCASGEAREVDPAVEQIKQHLSEVRHKLLVLSGKGGVGKSTFITQLAFGIAQDMNKQVSILDTDLCGPSIPRIMGTLGQTVHQSGSGWSPVYVEENLSVISSGFLMKETDALIYRGPKKTGLIKQLLLNVDWGELDYLLVDTPPGTSDEHLAIETYLSGASIDGAVIITTPQEVSLIDVRKQINFCKKVGIRIIGVVENMAGFACPKCKNETQIFPPSARGGPEVMAAEMSVPYIGKLPLEPQIARCCDEGKSFLAEFPDSPAAISFQKIIRVIQDYCEKKQSE